MTVPRWMRGTDSTGGMPVEAHGRPTGRTGAVVLPQPRTRAQRSGYGTVASAGSAAIAPYGRNTDEFRVRRANAPPQASRVQQGCPANHPRRGGARSSCSQRCATTGLAWRSLQPLPARVAGARAGGSNGRTPDPPLRAGVSSLTDLSDFPSWAPVTCCISPPNPRCASVWLPS